MGLPTVGWGLSKSVGSRTGAVPLSSTLYKISANNRRLEPIESSPPLELTVHDGHELMSNNRNCPINGGEPLPEHQKRSLPFFHTKQSAQSGLFRPDAAPWPSGRPANRDQTNMGSRVQSLNQTTDAPVSIPIWARLSSNVTSIVQRKTKASTTSAPVCLGSVVK